jgi:molybdate transport system ATP-binding protein
MTTLMSRPDLAWLREAVGLGAIFDATVARALPDRGLVELTFDGGVLVTGDRGLQTGAAVRVRIPAREVILATRPPEGLSLHNVLSGTVAAIHLDPAFDHAMVQVSVGRLALLAEVTKDAVARLGLTEGRAVHALVKSVSIDLTAVEGVAPPA